MYGIVTDGSGTAQAAPEPQPRRGWWSRHPLLALVARRLAFGLLLVLVVSSLAFFATALLPGDAVTAVLGRNASPARVAELRGILGLDDPLPERYWRWLSGMLRGDFGTSLVSGGPVSDLLGRRLLNSLLLAFAASVVLIPASIALGAWLGARSGSVADRALSTTTLVLLSTPEFVMGLVLAYLLGVQLRWFPPISLFDANAGPLARPEVLVLPALTMILVNLGYGMRMVRAGVASAMGSDYVLMARLNGVRERDVVLRYALPNSIAPSIQSSALVFLYLIAGVVVVEATFQYPGMGLLVAGAAAQRDLPVVLAVVVVVAVAYVLVNLVSDLLVILVTPRLRTAL